MNLNYKVSNAKYVSINQLLKEEFQMSSRLLAKLIKNKKILLNGLNCDTRVKPNTNDIIDIFFDYEEDNSNIESTEMKLDIIYEDEGLLVINKPAGIAIHPSLRHFTNSLSNGVKFYFDRLGLKKKIRPVNRLDLDTSGLVVFAKNEYIQECLIKQMKNGIFQKRYICLVEGKLKEKQGIIDFPIDRKEKSIIERCVSKNGKDAITLYEVIKECEEFSVIKCILKTGRTHQIRVHFAYIGHPLLGDTLYGNESKLISRQALHCSYISFLNPINNVKIDLDCDIPSDFYSFKL